MEAFDEAGYDHNFYDLSEWLEDSDAATFDDIGYHVVHINDASLDIKFYDWAAKRPVLKLIADYAKYHEYGGVLVVV
jgi:hypothetical protein